MATGSIILNMTGEEFKKLIEQNNPNGKIDTLPEMIKAFEGLSDDKTLKEYIEQEGGAHPAPQSVGTEELKDDSVMLEDLNTEVRGKIQKTYVEDEETLHMDFDEQGEER